ASFDEDSGNLAALHANVVGPFHPRLASRRLRDDLGNGEDRERGEPCRIVELRLRKEEHGEEQRRSRWSRPDPALPAAPGGLLFCEPAQPFVRGRRPRAGRDVFCPGHAVPARDAPADALGPECVFDSVGTQAFRWPAIGYAKDWMTLQAEAK